MSVPSVLFSEKEIQLRIKELGDELRKEYAGSEPVLVGVLSGAFVFVADLAREMAMPLEVEFVKVKSYQGKESTGNLQMLLPPSSNLSGRDVLIVEDIVDTGLTVKFLAAEIAKAAPRSLKVCCLLHKPAKSQGMKVDFCGFEIEDEFVVGYGLDFDGRYRGLPYIACLKDVSS